MDSPASKWSIDRAVAERDFAYLSALICDPNLPPDVREHLAKMVLALLTKKIDFPAHRLQKSKTFQEQMAIGSRIQDLKRLRAKKPFETVAVEFGCSVRKVQGCWAVYRDFSEEMSREKHRDDALMDMAHEAARDSAIAHLKEEHGDREFTDEEVSDEIEAQQQAWADFDDY